MLVLESCYFSFIEHLPMKKRYFIIGVSLRARSSIIEHGTAESMAPTNPIGSFKVS
jgi:hypothetical protein